MTTQSHVVSTRSVGLAAIAAIALGWMLIAMPAAAHAAGGTTTQTLARGVGMTGAPSLRVRTVQRTLRRHHYDLGSGGVDGRFGPDTQAAVRRFQARHGLRVDGIVGRSTRRALRLEARSTHRRTRSGRIPRGHENTPPGDAQTGRPTAPPAAPVAPPTTKPAVPAPPGALTPAPATEPAAARNGHTGTGWAVPLTIGVLAAVLVVVSAPMLWEPVPLPRRRRAAIEHRRSPAQQPRAAHAARRRGGGGGDAPQRPAAATADRARSTVGATKGARKRAGSLDVDPDRATS